MIKHTKFIRVKKLSRYSSANFKDHAGNTAEEIHKQAHLELANFSANKIKAKSKTN